MGRKPSTFSGLSQFVLEAFKQGDGPAASSSTAQPSSHQTPTPSRPSTSQKPQNFVTSQRAAPSDSASDSTSGDASPSIGVVRKADALDEVEPDEEEAAETRGGKGKSREKEQSTPARKKRKVGLLGSGYESVDATGLVPFYTDASEVPSHLRKCTPLPASTLPRPTNHGTCQISSSATGTSRFTTKDVCWTRRAGTASRPNASPRALRSDVGAGRCSMRFVASAETRLRSRRRVSGVRSRLLFHLENTTDHHVVRQSSR